MEPLRLPLLRRRQLGRRYPALHRNPRTEIVAESEPFRLRAGRKPVRFGRVLRLHPGNPGEEGERGSEPNTRSRGDFGIDQGVSRHREIAGFVERELRE